MKYHFRLPPLLMLMLLCVSASWGGNIYYVHCPDGNDANFGSGWLDAFRTIGKALQVAVAGDEIRVAGSTTNTAVYRERIALKNGVKVTGGYSGEGYDDVYDPKVYITVIDASGAGSVVTAGAGITTSAVIDGFTIRNGRAMNGGGINCYGGSPTIRNCRIANNTAVFDGYGYTFGGGIYCENASPMILNNTIENNQTLGNARSEGGGIFCGWEAMPTISGNVIRNNSVPSYQGKGGGIGLVDVGVTITNNTISNNTNDQVSCIYSAGPLIACNVIVGGTNGVYLGQTSSPAMVINNTIVGSGNGIYAQAATASISNNIIAFNTRGIYKSGTGTLTLLSNDVYGNTSANYTGVTPGTGDRSQDPCFVNRAGGDYHLLANSPCRDTGNNNAPAMQTYDYEGQARINNSTVDIGADEYHIIRVSWDGDSDDSNHGANWVHPKRTIAGALAASTPYSEIWVKQGMYYENINLVDAALLFGGFAGTETSRNSRNWLAHETVIDGDSQLAPAVKIEACPSTRTTIDGFIITGGTGYGSSGCSGGYYKGGGIYCVGSAPTISHNIIKENGNYTTYGGGAYLKDSAAKILNNVVMDNEAQFGAGIYCEVETTSSAPEIVNNTIVHNGTLSGNNLGGGGIDVGSYAGATIANNIVALNEGGILCSSPELIVHHHNCLYSNGSFSGELPLGTGDITSDPRFAGDGYHIQVNSPCRDHGSDSAAQSIALDIDSADRTYGVVDIGADENNDCVWYDFTLTGPTQTEVPLNADVAFTATVYDPTINEPVCNCIVEFVITGGEIRSIMNTDGIPGEIDGKTTGIGYTGQDGTVTITVRRSTRGIVDVFASIYGCFGTMEETAYACFRDPAVVLTQSDWPMFMRDSKHTGMSNVVDTTPETLNSGVPTWTAHVPTPPALANFARPCYDSSPVVAGDKVIVGTWNSDGTGDVYAYAVDAYGRNEGVLVWNARRYAGSSNMTGVVSTPCVANGKVYVGDTNGYVYCLNLSDGSPAWSSRKAAFESSTVAEGRKIYSSPVVFEGVVYVGNEASVAYAFDAVTGNRIAGWATGVWLGQLANYNVCSTSSPAIAVTTTGAKYLFIGSGDSALYRIRLGSTPAVSSVPLSSAVESSPTVTDQYVYVGTSNWQGTNVHKLRIDPFSCVLSTHVQAEVRPTLAYDGANLFTGCDTGTEFYRLLADSLDVETYFDAGKHFVGSAALTKGANGRAGVVYVGNDNGKFYARDPWELWTEFGTYDPGNITNAWVRSSPAIAYVSDATGHVDRWVFFTSKLQGGKLFAFKTDR